MDTAFSIWTFPPFSVETDTLKGARDWSAARLAHGHDEPRVSQMDCTGEGDDPQHRQGPFPRD